MDQVIEWGQQNDILEIYQMIMRFSHVRFPEAVHAPQNSQE